MIQVENLSKIFRVHQKEPGFKGSVKSLFKRKWIEKHALKNASLSVSAGEIVGLVGANGAGKTTLVKALSGIIHPTSGHARVLGYSPWERHDAFRRQIALIMGQKAQLWWDLPAADCFLLLREIYQIPKPQFEASLNHLADALQVRGQLNIQIRKLSLGERMKVELMAALLHNPKVVFLDEPTIGLDLTAQRAIRDFLLEYREAQQPAMLLTSHYMEDIEKLCKRLIILREGEIVYDGPIAGISRDFAHHKVLTFRLDPAKFPLDFPINLAHYPSLLGEALEIEARTTELLKIKVSRDRISEAASALLKHLPVLDLTIEEPDIGSVIENIMRGRSK